ncbi:MAG: zinc-binding dehydrogenase [Actinobacteria bacterium]|nr:zinc-binding dehydrogenase [Actinomycetota bacterium]
MLASRLYGTEDVRLDEVPDVEPGPGEVRLKVAHNGICGSDLHMYFQGQLARPEPFTIGHEFAGVVDTVGPGVTGIAPGTPVAVRPFLRCAECDRCTGGLPHLHAPMRVLGCGAAEGGGLAEYCVSEAQHVFALPDGVTLEQGALVEPMAVSYNGIRRGEVEPGMRTVIFGAGPIGIGVLLGLRSLGVDDVVVVEPSAARREAIGALGAAEVIDPGAADVIRTVMARTGGRGADVVFECAGVEASFVQSIVVAGARGRVVILAIYEQNVAFNPSMMMMDEIEVRGALGYEDGCYETVIDLMAKGCYPTDGWVEHIPWSGLIDEGFAPLRRGERMKVMVDLP